MAVEGCTTMDRGSASDCLSLAKANAFTQPDGLVCSRSLWRAAVHAKSSSGVGWSSCWGSGTETDSLGRLTLSDMENLQGRSQGDRWVGNAGANILDGQAGNGVLAGEDVLDMITGETEAIPFTAPVCRAQPTQAPSRLQRGASRRVGGGR